jgi:hypothetical protein
VKGNLQLKQLFTGITIALFTEEEMNILSRKQTRSGETCTITILLERVCSQLDKLEF